VPLPRRQFLCALLGAGAIAARPAFAQEDAPWYEVMGDDGRPVSNLRLPVELTSEIDTLRGAIWIGSDEPEVTLVEFYDFNCPYCRKAAPDLRRLLDEMPNLRLGLVNNPILSPGSVEAAKVELAVLKAKGAEAARRFHEALFARRGSADGSRALDTGTSLGFARAELEAAAGAADIAEALDAQMRLAASLGMAATPSFVLGGTGVLGYPGPKALARMIDTVRSCDQIVC
jgi:protein-disulfide isomerase